MYDPAFRKQNTFKCQILKRILTAIEWIYLFFAIGFLVAYIFLVLEWSILGAILNPVAYLAYASSAATFLTFLAIKYAQLKELHIWA